MSHAPCPVRAGRRVTSPDHELERAVEAFAAIRPRLEAIAQRIVGNRSEAEDVVQDAWLRWQLCDRTAVRNPTAFLVTTTARLALNVAQSARARREWSVDRWAPEPAHAGDEAAGAAEASDALADGILVLLQRLSPAERAAYVLRQAFGYPYRAIAELLQLTEANVRQLVSRGGRRLATGSPRPVSTHQQRQLVQAFVAASQLGDVGGLERLLAASAVATGRAVRPVDVTRVPVLAVAS